ncbi:DinB family protein [Streptomyces sp. NPDC046332]|uniref:DinB family protein n=1 Tax=Streptomyces sp. NPDC046332 TaxID=3155133 RepID=UPI0033F63851
MTSFEVEVPADTPLAGSEAAVLLTTLERMRALVEWKCSGLDAEGLRATLAPSTVTLGGLLKHLAAVEDSHFLRLMRDEKPGAPWDTVDWDADPDWDWRTAADDTPEELFALWRAAVQRSRVLVAELLAEGGLDLVGTFVSSRTGESPSLRFAVVSMIEEYARHAGHADLIRESVDGLVGEDPPRD